MARNESISDAPSSTRFRAVAAISALLLAGMIFGSSLWIIAAVVALLLTMTNAWLTKTWTTAVTAKRQEGDLELKIGSLIDNRIEISNASKIPVAWVLVEDLIHRSAIRFDPPAIEVAGTRIKVMRLGGGGSQPLNYQIRCNRRGYFQIGPTVLETGDLMGFYRRYRTGSSPRFLTVLPKVVPLTRYEIGSRRPIGEIRMRENVMSDPTRLRGIRQWQPGDPMRSVHWSATARTGTLHSKIYEPSSIIGATLILDLHEKTNPQSHEPIRTDLAITAAASIANALHEANEPFGLATNGRDAADRIREDGWDGDHRVRGDAATASEMDLTSHRLRPVLLQPNRGAVHLAAIMRSLARLERTNGLTLSELLVECESELSAETTLLLILQRCDEATIAAIISLSRRGREVAVIINTHDINDYSEIAGPLIAERIITLHLADEDQLQDVCRQMLIR